MRVVPQEHTVLNTEDLDRRMTLIGLIGLIGLIDPPRPEAIKAVAECHAGGIRKMITGDHAATARHRPQIGLRNTERVLTGADLETLDDAALADAAVETDLFARISPVRELRLVTALQARWLPFWPTITSPPSPPSMIGNSPAIVAETVIRTGR